MMRIEIGCSSSPSEYEIFFGSVANIIMDAIDEHDDFLQNLVLTIAGLLVVGILIIGA